MKKLILSLMMLLCISTVSMAQASMTDDEVLSYIVSENSKGVSQQKIVTDLISKGVSTAQLQRVRSKAMKLKAEQSQKGNSVAAAQENISASAAETRAEETGAEATPEETTTEELNDDIAETEEGDQRQVFGRNIFSNKNLTFQPSYNMATPQNYVLGSGDKILINMWGTSQNSIETSISPDGYIVLPNIGQVKLAGLTISQAKSVLKNKLGAKYGGSSVDMSLTDNRTIQIQVMGEVKNPGTYSISSLSSAFNALYKAGGISKIGTLRNIYVYRNGKKIANIDVYDYILNGNTKSDVRLQDGDVIVVGVYDCLVEISGNVKRPMWYEMKKDETAGDLIKYCGGFNGDAYTKNIRLLRKSGTEYSIHTIDEFQMNVFKMADEDRVEVDSIPAKFSNIVEVRGAAKHAGEYQLGGNIQTVKELLLAADGLSEDAYQERAIIHRKKDDLTLEMVSVDLVGIMNGTASDVPLKNNDVLFIPSKSEMLGEQTFTISGEVVYPGSYPYSDNTTLRDLILEAGGLKESASLSKVNVYRRIRDQKALEVDNTQTEAYTFSLDETFNIVEDTTFILKPYDNIVVRRSPAYTVQQSVFARGEVNFPGQHALLNKNYRLSDLIKAAGGLTNAGNAKAANLTRQMSQQEIDQRNKANRQERIDLLDRGLKSNGDFNTNLADSIMRLKNQWITKYTVAIDLEKAMANPGSEYDVILRAGDVLEIPEYSDIVNVTGEITKPLALPYESDKNLYYYINKAGGFTDRAHRTKVYGINANGSVKKLHANSVKDIQPGMKIVVPQKIKFGHKKMSTAEIVGITSGIASLAAVIVAVLNIVKKST